MKGLRRISIALALVLFFGGQGGSGYSSAHEVNLVKIDWERGVPNGVSAEARRDGLSISRMKGRSALLAQASIDSDYSEVANGAPRAEVELSKLFRFKQGLKYTVTWSAYVPSSVELDYSKFVIFTQIHQGTPEGAPTLAMTMLGDNCAISQRGGENSIVVSAGKKFCCISSDMNNWVDWRLEYLPRNSRVGALTKLWKDGRETYSAVDRYNSYSGDNSAYMKFGIYKPHWNDGGSKARSFMILLGPVNIIEERYR